MDKSAYIFFLGGHDLEMLTIRELLEEYAPGRFHDKGLSWGAKASGYEEEIEECSEKGYSIELLTKNEVFSGREPTAK